MGRVKLPGLAIFLLIVFLGIRASAQNTTATLVGQVKDPTGLAVPNATVTVTNSDTGEARVVTANDAGDFTVSLLKPGVYRVTTLATGFKSQTYNNIVLNVNQTARIDIALAVGQTTESINVMADSLHLDTDTAAIGQLISGSDIQALPLLGRNFQDLMFLAPGAVNNPGGEQSTYRITVSGSNVSAVSIGGSRGSSAGYQLDGMTILDIGYDTPAFGPSLDAVAEFSELSKGYSAAYGFSMNQINMTSKSGTNQYHGTVFEYLRNSYVDAIAHGTVITPNSTMPTLRLNQFGYALGGPVRIPWLYNGSGKTFFFANYEGFRQSSGGGSSAPASVPTSDEMQGKFTSTVLGKFTTAQAPVGVGYTQCGHAYQAGDPHPLFDPFDPNGCPFPVASDGSYTIPTSRISNLGKLIMRPGLYFPAGQNVNTTVPLNNYLYSTKGYLNFDQQNYRIDQKLSSKDQVSFHAVIHNEDTSSTAVTPTNSSYKTQPARFYTLTQTHIFSPNLTNQVRVGFLNAQFQTGPNATISSSDIASLNFPNPFTAPGMGYPRLEFDSSPLNAGYSYGGGGAFVGSTSSSNNATWDASQSATWNVGKHSLSMGFDFRRIILTLNPGNASLGRINYNGQYSGDTFADALLGASPGIALAQLGPTSNPVTGPVAHIHFRWLAPYFQDDWKVTDRMTLNLGLRYEYISTPFEEQNSFTWPDFDVPGGALYMPNSKIVAQFGGSNPFSPGTGMYLTPPNGQRGPGEAPKTNFAPRLGFAYRVFGGDKTVLRGGVGKYFDTVEANELQASSAGIYPGVANVATGTNAGLSYPPAFNTNSLPSASQSSPLLSYFTSPSTSQLGFIQVQAAKAQAPNFWAWNVGIQRELPLGSVLSIDYVANHGSNLFSRSNPNAPKQCIAANGCTVTANTAATIPWQKRTPYPNFGTLVYAGFDGWSNYHALNLKVEHRTNHMDLIAAYTWASQLDTKSAVAGFSGDNSGWAGPQDGLNIASDYGRGNFDVKNNFRFTMVYSLPFGRGRALLGNTPRAVDTIIGGWQFGTLTFLQSGLPFTVSATDIQGANNTYAERANINPTPAGFKRSLAHWYSYDSTPGSTDATYTQPAPGSYGTSGRNSIRMPGQWNSDMSLSKSFQVYERSSFQVRFEAFNIFNHWNPGQPSNYSLTGIDVGVIYPYNTQGSSRVLQASGRFSF